MRIDRQIFLAFVVILAIVMTGFIANLKFLFQMIEVQEKVDEEWDELNRMVEVQRLVAGINDKTWQKDSLRNIDADLKWDIDLLQDKVRKISGELKEEYAEDRTFHHQEEESYFREFSSEIERAFETLSVDSLRFGQWSPDRESGTRESLLKAERAGYQLQQADMREMMEATRQAERFRQKMIRWSLGIFVVLVLIIVAFSLWFTRIFRRKTDTLIRDEQLLTMAVMAQSLAHEIRNPLGIIKSSISVLRKKSESDAETGELLGYLVEETDRIDGLLKQLAHLSEGAASHHAENVSVIIEGVCAFMRPHAQKSGVEISYRDRTSGARIFCNTDQIKQLMINLLVNAIHASGCGQRIDVETLIDKNYYCLVVSDHGTGMDAKIKKRLFDPFFTTKSRGAGLGLVVVKKIVDWHKGRVDVISAPGQGTTFKIYFPKDSNGGRQDKNSDRG